jgi:gliding motility-associated-like protein
MNPLLTHIYQSTVTKYIKFRKRLDKNISSGKFKQFTRRKQGQLLHKIERLRRRILQLQTQLKLAGAGVALSLFLQATPTQAQTTTLGPFNRNYLNNPLPPPLPRMEFAAPAYVDLDGDADLDLVVGDEYTSYLRYFRNIGTQTKPYFLEIRNIDPEYPFGTISELDSYRNHYVPAFADIDNDGDFDMLLGTDKYNLDYEGKTYFFQNIGTATAPNFDLIDATNPFSNVETERMAYPTFVNFDGDGDMDLLLGGYQDESTLLKYYKNTGTASSPIFVLDQNAPNIGDLLLSVNNHYTSYSAPNAFADLDQDGDLDFFFSEGGEIHYRRNDGGNFAFESAGTNQTGPWTPNAANPGASTGNPFHSINAAIPNNFAFVDLDHDGDLDVTISYYIDNPPYAEELRPLIFYENTGRGVFQVKTSVLSPVDGVDVGDSSSSSFADIDSDGDLDVLAAGSISYTTCPDACYDVGRTFVSVLRNNNGTFVDVSEDEDDKFYEIPLLARMHMKLIPVDNDAIPEMVVPYFDENAPISGKIKYFKLEGGHYIEKTGSENPFNTISIVGTDTYLNLDLGDLNGDNLPDLILGIADNRLQAYRNTGTAANPIFIRETTWETGFLFNLYSAANPKILDLDHDGDLDIVVGKYDNIWYYENSGTSTAPVFVQYTDQDDENPFAAVNLGGFRTPTPNFFDVDKDGDEDLIFGAGSGQFQYYENQNPAPSATLNATDLNVTGGTAIVIDPALTIADTDNDAIVRATVSIQSFQSGNEVLSFTPQAGITGNFDTSTGILTLSGKATLAAYQAILRTITHNFTGAVPGGKKSASGKTQAIARTISFQVFDADLTTPLIRTRTINVAAPNAAPAIVPQPILTKQGTSVTVNILPFITDTNGNFTASASTLTITQQPGSGAVASLNFVSASVVELTINYAGRTFSGTESMQIQACDQMGACVSGLLSIQVAPNIAPVIVPEPVAADAGANVTINVLPLITDADGNFSPSPSTITIIQQPTSGASASLVFVSASVVNLLVDYSGATFSGLDQIQIQACDDLGACTTSIIAIQVNAASEIIVYNAFSPNAGDNINSFFNIRHIEVVSPQNKVTIYNRWGDAVFEISDYNNTTRKFEGLSDNGKELPTGTYFYKIAVTGKTITGYLSLKR